VANTQGPKADLSVACGYWRSWLQLVGLVPGSAPARAAHPGCRPALQLSSGFCLVVPASAPVGGNEVCPLQAQGGLQCLLEALVGPRYVTPH
jgi:hypothetical protein